MITSGQPSLNPRLVKEADSLAEAGYKVTVLYAYWNDWGTGLDKPLLIKKKWRAIRVAGDPQQKPITFFVSRIIHRLSVLITRKFKPGYFARFAIARSSFFLIREARKHLYICHNLGALPATVRAAKAHQKPCGFDAEDLHRYEESDNNDDFGVILKTYIENKYIPQVNYLTASSPGIGDAYHQLYKDKMPVTLLNVFPIDYNIPVPAFVESTTIKLFWFSQTVDHGRGLDNCLKALQIINNPSVELHLLGFVSEEVRQEIISSTGGKINIKFHYPISPDEIVSFAAQFDIGLALEDSVPLNRDICLTNKIFTYIQAGLAIVASDTTAQSALLGKYPGIGQVYKKGDTQMLATLIENYNNDRHELNKAKKASWDIARSVLNWEKESEKFLNIVKDTLAV